MTPRQPPHEEFGQRLRETTDEFRDRLDLLEESSQVTPLARWLTESSLARIGQTFELRLTEENAAQFVTHLAIALTRLQRGDPPVELSAVVADELKSRAQEREMLRSIMTECEDVLDRRVPDVEIDYMTVHLCALLEE
jgi:hypothetical protein